MCFDQTWVELLQHLWPNAHTFGGVGTEVRQEDIRRGRDLLRHFLAFWVWVFTDRDRLCVQIEKVCPADRGEISPPEVPS